MTFPVEFQAVVMAAGRGSRMAEITTGKPKCLLPIGPKPLIWYPLYKLQQSGFSEVMVVVLESEKSEIQNCLEKSDLDIKIDFVTVPESHEDLGTAESLRLRQDKLKSDVLIVSCDLITDVNFKEVLDLFRMHDASIASLLIPPMALEGVVPGPKSKQKPERDLIGVDVKTNRIVFLASASDFEGEFSLPMGLLRKHPDVKFFSTILDSHVYVLKNWIIKYLTHEKAFTSIKGDLLPHIIKKQLVRPDSRDSLMTEDPENSNIYSLAKESETSLNVREVSAFNDHQGDLKSSYHGDSVRCYAFLAASSNFGIRVNNLPAFWHANNLIQSKFDQITGGKELVQKHAKADVKSNQIDPNCIIWEAAKLHEKTSFKNCIIGSNSEVRSFSRVFNSVIMNNVKIHEKVALENCIVCDNVTVEEGSKLKGCIIGNHQRIATNSDHCNEIITQTNMEF